MGKNGETICGLLDEFDRLAESLGITQDNAHRAAWLEYNKLALNDHGWWYDDTKGGSVCSACSYVSVANFNYCPHCGANMRVRR